MKQFILFAGNEYESVIGGWCDKLNDYDTLAAAQVDEQKYRKKYDWTHIVDMEKDTVVFEWMKYPGNSNDSFPCKNEKVKERLLEKGSIERIPEPITDFTPYEKRIPFEIKGKPLSQTIIEERR